MCLVTCYNINVNCQFYIPKATQFHKSCKTCSPFLYLRFSSSFTFGGVMVHAFIKVIVRKTSFPKRSLLFRKYVVNSSPRVPTLFYLVQMYRVQRCWTTVPFVVHFRSWLVGWCCLCQRLSCVFLVVVIAFVRLQWEWCWVLCCCALVILKWKGSLWRRVVR